MAKSRTVKSNLFQTLEHAAQPVFLLDPELQIVFANQALAEWLDSPVEEITAWQCSYSGSDSAQSGNAAEAGAFTKAAGLCPPPDAFESSMRHTGRISRHAAEGLEFRNTTFLGLIVDGTRYTLAVADAEPAATKTPTAISQHGGLDLHDLLKIVRAEMELHTGLEPVLGTSPVALRIQRQLRQLGTSASDFTIVGPKQSGRRQLAETVNLHGSVKQVMIPLDAASSDPEVIQSMIRQVFATGDDPQGERRRLLLLDADRLDSASQLELREFFNMQGFDLSVVATASRPLLELAENGDYDFELAHRLSTFVVEIPPLSERAADISMIVQALIEELNEPGGKQIAGTSGSAARLLREYHWPGEFAELAQTVAQACAVATGPNLVRDDLPKRLHQAESARQHPLQQSMSIELQGFLRKVENELIRRALAISDGNKAEAARMLGMSRASLVRRCAQMDRSRVATKPGKVK